MNTRYNATQAEMDALDASWEEVGARSTEYLKTRWELAQEKEAQIEAQMAALLAEMKSRQI